MELRDVVEAWAGLRVLVVGDLLVDSYADGEAERLCREAPVPVVAVGSREDHPGGAANAAANLRALGAEVAVVGVLGHDEAGDCLDGMLAAGGVDTAGIVRERRRRTLRLTRVRAGGQLLVRLDEGDRRPIDAPTEGRVCGVLRKAMARCDAVLVSDYNAGTITDAVRDELARGLARSRVVSVVDAKHIAAYRTLGVTAVKPNWAEASVLLGLGGDVADRAALLAREGERILELSGARIAAVTLDAEGAQVFERGRPAHRTYATPRPHSAAIGAGDTFVAALTLGLAAGVDGPTAAELASRAADVVLARSGTAVCRRDDLLGSIEAERKVVTAPAELRRRLTGLRDAGRKVVFANGCFDLVHRGHIAFLNQAKELGDVLVVGVNSDASVRRLKGPDRPINPLADRLAVLAALSCVDLLVPFDEATATPLVRRVRPDVYAKGRAYERGRLPERSALERMGVELHFLPEVPEHSTTGLIHRIRAAATA